MSSTENMATTAAAIELARAAWSTAAEGSDERRDAFFVHMRAIKAHQASVASATKGTGARATKGKRGLASHAIGGGKSWTEY